jgi:redox-sensitive bicupin YhaK (pirin superfamily)
MIKVRKSEDRGHFDHGWLNTFHTFSFAEYRNPGFMGFGPIRVINEDRVKAGRGFPTHFHADMEILSYVIDGALEHLDSMGNGSVIRPGELQYMSAGSGVQHSEYNPSKKESAHFLQIWIQPEQHDLPPRYQQITVPESEREGKLRLVASHDGRQNSIAIRQALDLSLATLTRGQRIALPTIAAKNHWVQIVRGAITLNQTLLGEGDGAGVEGEANLEFIGTVPRSEFLVFSF